MANFWVYGEAVASDNNNFFWVYGEPNVIFEVASITLKEVADSLGLSDAVLAHKTFVVLDLASLGDFVLRDTIRSVVGTTTNPYSTQATFQRKTFYAAGRFWVFWAKTSTNQLVFQTSTNGLTWSSETVVRSGNYGPHISIYFDGVYVHYASTGYGTNLYYRRGTPNSDGSITWSADEQTVVTTYSKASNPHITVDSNGYVWIGYRELVNGKRCPFVVKSGNNDGTWGTTPTGFPFQLSDVQKDSWAVSPVKLTGGKVLVAYVSHDSTPVYGDHPKVRVWNGSSWLAEVSASSGQWHSMFHSVVAQGDDAHLVFIAYPSLDIVYTKYQYSTNSFGSETVLQEDVGEVAYGAPVIVRNPSNDDLYVLWVDVPVTDHIFYRRWNGSSWESVVDWIDESAEGLNVYSSEGLRASDTYSCFENVLNGRIGFLYLTKTASPFNVRFAHLLLGTQQVIVDVVEVDDAVLRDKSLKISDSLGVSDSVLGNKNPLVVTEVVSLADFVEVITGAIIKTVLDSIGAADLVLVNKPVAIADAVSVLDTIFRNKPYVSVLDVVGIAEAVLVSKLLMVADSVSLADVLRVLKALNVSDTLTLLDAVSTPSRVRQVLDNLHLLDGASVNKILVITENVSLVEIVQVGKGAAGTSIYLVIDNLVIDLKTGKVGFAL